MFSHVRAMPIIIQMCSTKGLTLSGTYSVQDGVVTVTTAIGSKSTQVGSAKPASLAYVMLRQLFDDFHTDSPPLTADQPP